MVRFFYHSWCMAAIRFSKRSPTHWAGHFNGMVSTTTHVPFPPWAGWPAPCFQVWYMRRLRFSSQFCLPSSSDSSLARLLNLESVAQRDSEYVATWGPGSGRNPEFLTGTLTDDSQEELEILRESVWTFPSINRNIFFIVENCDSKERLLPPHLHDFILLRKGLTLVPKSGVPIIQDASSKLQCASGPSLTWK